MKRSSDCGDERMPRSDIVTVAKAAYFLMTQSVENLLSAYYVRWGGTTASPRVQTVRIKLAETAYPNPLSPPLELNEFPRWQNNNLAALLSVGGVLWRNECDHLSYRVEQDVFSL